MRGLAVFISDIRNCKSREAEIKRINKELANIRSKFRGDKTLDGYQKKKYVCKLLFIFLLGHDIDFGHMEAVNLLSSNKYTEKQIGYLFISVLVNPNSELMKLVIQSLKNDLASKNPVHVCLALTCIANLGSKEMAEAFGNDIPKFLTTGDSIDSVKQSASLCLLKLFRAHPDCLSPSDWASRVIHLLNDQHLGVVTAASSLIDAVVRKNPEEYKNCATLAVSRLSRLVTSSYTDLQDYTYYFVPAPWLSVKLLRLLQNWPDPNTAYDAVTRAKLVECLDTVLNKAAEPPKSKKVQHSNARNAVLFEAIDLIAHCFSSYSPNESAAENFLIARACEQLGRFLQHRETNLRYLALESMKTLVEGAEPGLRAAVKRHREAVVAALKNERDASVRRRAADLLYASCDESCEDCEEICGNLMAYLTGEGCVGPADYTAREETVLKIAALAESYARDYAWYVDTILNLIRVAGDHVGEEVWYRAVQIIVNREEVQGYAAKTVFEALLQRPPLAAGVVAGQAGASNATHYFCHENMVKVAGYVLGEFGNLIAGDPRSAPAIQFQALHSKFALCSAQTRALLLSTYVKFINLFPEIKAEIQEVLRSDTNIRNSDPEIQQRAVEYLKLSSVVSTDVLAVVLEEMPPFPERETSLLLGKLKTTISTDNQNNNTANNSAATTSNVASNNGSHSQPGPALPKRPPTTPAHNAKGHQADRSGPDDLLLLSLGSPPQATPSTTATNTNGTSLTDHNPIKYPEVSDASSTRDILLEIFHDNKERAPLNNGEFHKGQADGAAQVVTLSSGSRPQILAPFWGKPGAVLFENNDIQVGAKLGDFANGVGSLQIFYGNKSANARFTGIRTRLVTTDPENSIGIDANCLSLSTQALEVDTLEPGSQLQQKISVECSAPPEAPFPQPQLCLEFCKNLTNLPLADPFSAFDPNNDGGDVKKTQMIKLKTYLPVTLNRFLEPLGPQTPMDQTGFFQRWKNLVLPGQEYQKVFGATVLPIDPEANRTKLTSFGFAVLSAIDSNLDNAVGAGIIKTKSQQVGCLLRLEPNMKTQMYRLTLRTTKPAISLELGTLLTDMGIF